MITPPRDLAGPSRWPAELWTTLIGVAFSPEAMPRCLAIDLMSTWIDREVSNKRWFKSLVILTFDLSVS